MTDEQKKKCRKIIHTAEAVAAVIGLGVAMVSKIDSWVVGVIRIVMIGCIGNIFGRHILDAVMASVVGFVVSWVGVGLFIGWPAAFIAERIAGFGELVLAIFASVIYVLNVVLVTNGTGWLLAHSLAAKERKQAESHKDNPLQESSGQ